MKFSKFQKLLVSMALACLVILLAGCPYSSTVPIDQGSVKIPDKLVGNWIKTADKETENPSFIEIVKDDANNATALKYEFSSSDSVYESTKYHLTLSNVDGETFMNLIEEGGSSYYLFKMEFDEANNEITTYELTDYIRETFNSSDELKNFISKNKAVSYFYTTSVDTYVRK